MPAFAFVGGAEATASLSPELRAALARAPADEPLRLVVRLHDFASERDARELGALGVAFTTRLTTVPIYGATATPAAAARLLGDARVAYVELDLPLHYHMEVAARETRARDLWDPLPGTTGVTVAGQPVDGRGVGVAVVDSGVDATHPDLAWGTHVKKNYFRTVALANTFTTGVVPDAANFVDVPDSDLTSGHGTHVAGTVGGSGAASNGLIMGAAPGATIYAYGMGQGLSIIAANEAFDHILRNFDSFDPPIKVVTNSYGSCGDRWNAQSSTSVLVGRLLEKDVNVVWSAGNIDSTCTNQHGGGAADDPRPGVLGVGNYDGSGAVSRDATIAPSSSQGFADQPSTMWPDVAAPGTEITATGSTTGVLTLAPGGYATISGTSMAAPHVAGIIALLRQADPTLTAAEVEQVLRRTAYHYDDDIDPVHGHVKKGTGLVDAFAAVHAVTGGLGANEGVQALDVTQGATTTGIRRTAAETAFGNVTLSGDARFLPGPGATYAGTFLFFHRLPNGQGVNPTLGLAPYAFAPGETMVPEVRGIRTVGNAPAPLGQAGRFVATHVDTGEVLFDLGCIVVFEGSVTSQPDHRCRVGFGVPTVATPGLYEAVFSMTVNGSPVEVAVENVYVLSAGAGAETLVDLGPRPPAPAPGTPPGAASVRARVDAGPWTNATVAGSSWSVDLTIPAPGAVVSIEATNGARVLTDRVVFGVPTGGTGPVPQPDPDVNLTIATPGLVLLGSPASFSATVQDPGTWTIEWDADYDGTTFDVDGAGATFTWTYATTGPRFLAARASNATLDGIAVVTVTVLRETVLLDATKAQGPAVPLSLVSSEAGATDPQATVYEVAVPPGTTRLVTTLAWQHYARVPVATFLTANDLDLWFRDPAGGHDHHGGATDVHGEIAVIASPAAGAWDVEVAPFLVTQPDTFHVVVKAYGV